MTAAHELSEIDAKDMLYEIDGWRVVRLNEARDVTAVTELSFACADYFDIVMGEPPKPNEGEEFFHDVPPGRTIDDVMKLGIHDAEHRLIGLIEILRDYPKPGIWYIGLLLVHPENRRQGVGRTIMTRFSEFAKLQGIQQLMLTVVEENSRALLFWTSLGFQERRRVPSRRFGVKDHNLIEFEKFLADSLL